MQKPPKTGKRRISSAPFSLPRNGYAVRAIRTAYLLPKKMQLVVMDARAYLRTISLANDRSG